LLLSGPPGAHRLAPGRGPGRCRTALSRCAGGATFASMKGGQEAAMIA
jgi:hypothetical protein